MPLLRLKCTKEISDELLKELSAAVAETIGKSEKYVMVVSDTPSALMMDRSIGDAAYADIKSIGGLNRVVNHELSMKICVLLGNHLGIPAERVYITFQSVDADYWGWNGSIFG